MVAPSSFTVPGTRRTLAVAALAIVSAAALVACEPVVPGAKAEAVDAATPPSVPVTRVTASTLDSSTAVVARIEASQRVDLQARVSGPIAAVLFREGDVVRAGQPLFQIDPRPFDVVVARARADLQLAQARESLAAREADRAKALHAQDAIAAEVFERRVAAHAEAQAVRAAAEAALHSAQLEREFTQVRAPIEGRIGRAVVTAGNFVAAGNHPTALASIVSLAPLHAHFDVADRAVLEQLGERATTKGWRARIFDADGVRELAQAPVDFADHSIDPGTGTLRLRARVDGPPPHLRPGQYVRVRLSTGAAPSALLVPDKAIGTDQGKRFVLVVDAAGKVEYRAVRVAGLHESRRIVTDGLKAGEQVIVSGLMRVQPGMTVHPQAVDDVAPVADAASAPSRL